MKRNSKDNQKQLPLAKKTPKTSEVKSGLKNVQTLCEPTLSINAKTISESDPYLRLKEKINKLRINRQKALKQFQDKKKSQAIELIKLRQKKGNLRGQIWEIVRQVCQVKEKISEQTQNNQKLKSYLNQE